MVPAGLRSSGYYYVYKEFQMRYYAIVNEGDDCFVLADIETDSVASADRVFRAHYKDGSSKPYTTEEFQCLIGSIPTIDTETDEYEQTYYALDEDNTHFDAIGTFTSRADAWAHANLQPQNYSLVINGLEAVAAPGDLRYMLTQRPVH
jgi:hypothetical protein